MDRFEYLTVIGHVFRSDDRELNEYGGQGWELVAVAKPIISLTMTYYFKRRKPD